MNKGFIRTGIIAFLTIIIMFCLIGCSANSEEGSFERIFGFMLSPYAEIRHFQSVGFGGSQFDIVFHQSNYDAVMSDFKQFFQTELAMEMTENQFNESFLDGRWWDRHKMEFIEGYQIDVPGKYVKTSGIWIVIAKENDLYHLFIEHTGG